MSLPTVFDVCTPRDDVLTGSISESDFAADLAQVVRGEGPIEYRDPVRFFENTYPTRGLKSLLENVCRRLSGKGGEVASIFRLDTQFGGGKTHGLIALVHAARGMEGVKNVSEFIDSALLPKGKVRVATFDGENADPLNGRTMGDGIRAHTPWGEIAWSLAGKEGYERVQRSDEGGVAPGADTLRELFGGEPTLILLDELSVYLRKVKNLQGARDQLTAFLTSLFKAVEGTRNAALVYTLAIGKDGRSSDAYSAENQFIADRMAEAESVSARKATLLNPTEDDETASVLRRRLFAKVDEARLPAIFDAYRAAWKQNEGALSPEAARPETLESFRASYPLHPDVLETLTEKVATLSNFQRVRGMLRLLARTVGRLWETRPADAHAIHIHHIDLGYGPIRQELLTRLGLSQYTPALNRDVAGEGANAALAQQLDADHYRGMPPYASYVARTVFIHTLAFNDQLRGISPEHLRYSIVGPGTDLSFIDDARKRFVEQSAFLDDRPGVPLRLLAEANLTQIIRRQEGNVDPGDTREQLRDRIRSIFSSKIPESFNLVPFPGGPYEVPDEVGDGRPLLVLLGYDAVSVGLGVETVPHLVERIFTHKGAEEAALRLNRNALVFLVADDARKEEMRGSIVRRLALLELKKPERLAELAEHQQAKVRELERRSEQEAAVAIQQCYRHLFYPSRADRVSASVDLAHTAISVPSASANPGSGQSQVMRALGDNRKLRTAEDEPDSPAYVRDRTPLKKGEITTRTLREEFRRDPGLPMLIGDDVFVKGIRQGVEQGEYVYKRGDLLYGPGDPQASIMIDEQSTIFTTAFARERSIWPRPAPKPPKVAEPPAKGGGGGDEDTGTGGEESRTPPASGPPPGNLLTAEGVLREALARLWEQARSRKLARIHLLEIRMYDPGDAFKLLGVVGSVQGADKTVRLDGEYETVNGGTLNFAFEGPSTDAQALKEFLEPQLRAAGEKNITADFRLRFEAGLSLTGDAAERLSDRLARYAAGSAYVSAEAEPAAEAAEVVR